eukprot:10137766-Ditylum_brightwellii.AAC.1
MGLIYSKDKQSICYYFTDIANIFSKNNEDYEMNENQDNKDTLDYQDKNENKDDDKENDDDMMDKKDKNKD